jgi:predicted nucleotidyltransferase
MEPVHDAPAVERRRAIAERAAVAYRSNPHVAGVLLAGSVARGLADDLSDIEIDVYWTQPPTDEERRAAVEGVGWSRVYDEVDEHEWADGYLIDGIKVDTGGFLTTTIAAYLDAALEHADTEPELQVRITALLHGRPLHGDELIGTWRDRCTTYPEPLALAMVQEGLQLRPRERLEMLVARDDPLLLHRDLVDNVQGVLDALFGINRVFVPHPFHKWLDWEATLLPTKPDGLVVRIRRLLVSPPGEGMELVCALAEETFDLAERLVPAYDAASARTAFEFRRAT